MVVPGEGIKKRTIRGQTPLLAFYPPSCRAHVTLLPSCGHSGIQQYYWEVRVGIGGAGETARSLGPSADEGNLSFLSFFQIHSRSFCSFRTRIFSSRGRRRQSGNGGNIKVSRTPCLGSPGHDDRFYKGKIRVGLKVRKEEVVPKTPGTSLWLRCLLGVGTT